MSTVNAGVHVCLCGGGGDGSGKDLSASALECSGKSVTLIGLRRWTVNYRQNG